MVAEASGRWKLSQGQLEIDTKKAEVLSILASGPEFGGMSEQELEREMAKSAEGIFVGRIFARELSLGTLVLHQQIGDILSVTYCERPEAARAAAEDAKALRDASN